jgi:hypothetical protein
MSSGWASTMARTKEGTVIADVAGAQGSRDMADGAREGKGVWDTGFEACDMAQCTSQETGLATLLAGMPKDIRLKALVASENLQQKHKED